MARYCGEIGYAVSSETSPGVWTDGITKRVVYGDIYKYTSQNQKSENANDNISLSMKISFIADPFAMKNFSLISFAKFNGVPWKVLSVDVEHPRLILTLGGVWNGQQ